MYKVMVADDEPKIRRGLCKFIERAGMPLTVCAQAADGVEALRELSQSLPDIVLLDICMPNMHGLAFLSEAKSVRKNSKYIVITGYDHFSFAQKSVALHAYAYLLKPINEAELLNCLKTAVEELDAELDEEKKSRQAWKQLEHNQRLLQEALGVKRTNESTAAKHPLITEIQALIDQNFADPGFCLGDLARLLSASQSYISRLMKSELSTTFVDYLTTRRVNEAISLMAVHENKLSWISAQVGYANQHYFCTVFKKHTGMSPSMYRGKV